MQGKGIVVENMDLDECKSMMAQFMKEKPSLWNEDIGVADEKEQRA